MALQELGDKAWFPKWMRQHQMEFLAYMAERLHLYRPVLPQLQSLLSTIEKNGWTDACSGEGGPVHYLARQLELPYPVLLTDIASPAQTPATGRSIWHPQPVALPEDPIPGEGIITLFNAWHHFSHAQQQGILQKAAAAGRPILIAEILQPHVLSWLSVTVAATLGQWLFAPWIRPFRWSRLFFTYVVPIHLLTVLYDGWLSVLHSQSAQQMHQAVSGLQQPHYAFTTPSYRGTFSKVTCIVGMPTPLPAMVP